MLFFVGTAAKTYALLTLFATLCTITVTYFFLLEKEDLLIDQKHLQLMTIATALDRAIDIHHLDEEIARVDALPISQKEKALLIKNWIQPILMDVSNEYPGLGLGIYLKQLEEIIAISPEFNDAYLEQVAMLSMTNVYETKRPLFTRFDNSTKWYGEPVFNYAHPIFHQGTLLGHAWGTAKVDDVMQELQSARIQVLTVAVLIWLIILLVIWLAFNNMTIGLNYLATYIRERRQPEAVAKDFPELQFLIDDIYDLRKSLQREYEQRELMLQELAHMERLNSVGDMAASIGHEVRNPMTTVRGYLQLFQRKEKFADHSEQLATMIEELDRANSIITEFLSLAKNKSIDMKNGNLNNVIHSLYPLLQADAFRRGHEIFIDLGNIPNSNFDNSEIRQLLLNLVRNGLEAIPCSGRVTIRNNYGQISLSVEDTGTGIPDEVMAKLGMPFVTTKEEGTGLGLPVCYRIAERHGGKISVETSPMGTIFTIRFPLGLG